MDNYTKMVQLSKSKVQKRLIIVEQACNDLITDKIELSYKSVCEKTQIPAKTLMREPYKTMINSFRNNKVGNYINNSDIEKHKKEIRDLIDIIKQLNRENHNLKTLLYENGLI